MSQTKPIYSSCAPRLSAYSPAAASFLTSKPLSTSYSPGFSCIPSPSQVPHTLPTKVPTPSDLPFEDTRSPLNVTVKSFCILVSAHPLGTPSLVLIVNYSKPDLPLASTPMHTHNKAPGLPLPPEKRPRKRFSNLTRPQQC